MTKGQNSTLREPQRSVLLHVSSGSAEEWDLQLAPGRISTRKLAPGPDPKGKGASDRASIAHQRLLAGGELHQLDGL